MTGSWLEGWDADAWRTQVGNDLLGGYATLNTPGAHVNEFPDGPLTWRAYKPMRAADEEVHTLMRLLYATNVKT